VPHRITPASSGWLSTKSVTPSWPLAPAAYEAWRVVEDTTAQKLLTLTGGLVIEDGEHRARTDTGSRNIDGYASTFTSSGVDFEVLEAKELMQRWPQFHLAGDERAIYQTRIRD